MKQLALKPDADLEIRAHALLCDYYSERDRTAALAHVAQALGDARSLAGGQLLVTPLMGADQQVYAVAQGPLAIGGFAGLFALD